MRGFRKWIPVAMPLVPALGWAQQTPVRPAGWAAAERPERAAVGPSLWRVEGRDAWSGVRYVRVLLTAGTPASEPVQTAEAPALAGFSAATLTAQCTQEASGKLRFELLANFGGVADTGFYPPWHSSGLDDQFPPPTRKVMLTMEFLGYTKVKPFKRQFEEVTAPGPEQLRYMNPGSGSSNMEPAAWFLQYLRALPTLRLSGGGHSAEFATAGWLAQLHKEPLCGASGA